MARTETEKKNWNLAYSNHLKEEYDMAVKDYIPYYSLIVCYKIGW